MTGTSLSIQAPCKINLHLKILERRPDGFHNLEGLFALLDWGDTLTVSIAPEKTAATTLRMDCEGPCAAHADELAALPVEKNLAYRAAALFREVSGFDRNIAIHITKRIPPGSGLGGGSSNAAAVLSALNTLAGNPCSPETLPVLAARLGSDAPFFLCGAGMAWVKGRGEQVEPLPLLFPPYGVLLAFPGFQNSTPAAYALLDERRRAQQSRDTPSRKISRKELDTALSGNPALWPFGNDFLDLFLEENSREGSACRAVLDTLTEAGALFSGLSGSGSACFGVYRDRNGAEQARAALAAQDYCAQTTIFLALS
jgi:4-diphosphocytidyl-2-C-methyl-D-erythritol kinase